MEKHHLELLGWKVKDKVTGFKGVVTHIGVDLYGCIQAIVHPPIDVMSKLRDSAWFDIARLEKVGPKRVMKPIGIKGDLTVAGGAHNHPTK